MTPEEFKQARQSLGLTQLEAATVLHTTPQTVRRYEMPVDRSTHRQVPPITAAVVGWLLAGFRPPEWPKGK